ncbi:MAG: glycoside hydrolase family 3 protein, partial [Candidatus Kapaibacterium sp.]
IEDLQRRAGRRLIIAADYEHGLPMRLDGGIAFPRAMALGRGLASTTEHIASLIAEEARAIGVHWNWAPVADINSNPRNPIVNTRSFGETAELVAEHAAAYVRGTQSRDVLACIKHVPGHGDTHVDSHRDLPTIELDQQTAAAREFAPFLHCIRQGVCTLMMGHIRVPFLDADNPASLSAAVVTDLVRRQWGFTGLITTDALDMGAITSSYTSSEAAVMAVTAGVDVVLMPNNPDEAIDALSAAIASGEISDERLRESEERWDAARAFVGVRTATAPKERPRPAGTVDQNAHALVALRAADAAIRVVGDASLLPITNVNHIAAFAIVDDHSVDSATTWFNALAQGAEVNADFGYVDMSITDDECASLADGIADADLVLFGVFGKAVAYRGELGDSQRLPDVLRKISRDKPSLLVACGSPYGIDPAMASTVVYTYSDTLPSIAASVLRLIGRAVPEN